MFHFGRQGDVRAEKCDGFVLALRAMTPALREHLYLPVKELIPPSMARLIYKALLLKHWRGEFVQDDQVATATSFYSEPVTDALLCELQPKIESLSGCSLVPAYTYARLYFYGNVLDRHRDREACEISASVNLGCDGGDPAIWFEPNNRVEMQPGDGAIYLGREATHWRPAFSGDLMGQLFVHYVIAGGPYAEHEFDRRGHLFPPRVTNSSSTR